MLFSSVSPRQRIVTLRAWFEKYSAAWPAELPAPTMWTSSPCVSRRLAARRAVVDALADEPLEPLDREPPPRDAAGEDDRARAQDVAAVEVHLARRRRRCRVIDRVTRISAPSRRACCSARLASSSPDTPDGKPR